MVIPWKSLRFYGFLLVSLGISSLAHGAAPPVSPFDVQDYRAVVSTHAWDTSPGNRHRLFLDVYNVTDMFDAETGGTAGFTDQTILADTIRPTATVLWDEHFRIQIGLIAEKTFGDSVGFGSVDPWIQLLWQPARPLSVVLGNLDTPHYFLPALFYPTNYFAKVNHETGMQVIFKNPSWYDDLYYNYRLQDNDEHNEKFDLGFVHHNLLWEFLNLHYQAHWIHEGGELNSTPISTVNDVAQAGGAGVQFHPFSSVQIGANYYYLHSHLRQDSLTPSLNLEVNGNGTLYEVFLRWSRLKLIYDNWQGHRYSHEGGDPMFTLPDLNIGTIRWDILLSPDFNLFAEITGYFVGTNSQGYNHDAKSSFLVEASWQFSIPIMEWTSAAASPEGQPVPSRWDYGL